MEFLSKKINRGSQISLPTQRTFISTSFDSFRGKKVSRQTEKQKEDEVLKSVLFLFKGRSEIFLTNGQPNLFQNLTKRIASHSSKKSTIIWVKLWANKVRDWKAPISIIRYGLIRLLTLASATKRMMMLLTKTPTEHCTGHLISCLGSKAEGSIPYSSPLVLCLNVELSHKATNYPGFVQTTNSC